MFYRLIYATYISVFSLQLTAITIGFHSIIPFHLLTPPIRNWIYGVFCVKCFKQSMFRCFTVFNFLPLTNQFSKAFYLENSTSSTMVIAPTKSI